MRQGELFGLRWQDIDLDNKAIYIRKALKRVKKRHLDLARQNPKLEHPDLVTVALRVPHGVLCLISALAFHDITTELPHEIYLALERGVTRPRIEEVPLRTFWFSGEAYREGIETHHLDSIPVRVYNPEKTLADCFKYRNKLGMETVLEALRLYRQRKLIQVDSLIHYARICRVERVMRPYLEAVLT